MWNTTVQEIYSEKYRFVATQSAATATQRNSSVMYINHQEHKTTKLLPTKNVLFSKTKRTASIVRRRAYPITCKRWNSTLPGAHKLMNIFLNTLPTNSYCNTAQFVHYMYAVKRYSTGITNSIIFIFIKSFWPWYLRPPIPSRTVARSPSSSAEKWDVRIEIMGLHVKPLFFEVIVLTIWLTIHCITEK